MKHPKASPLCPYCAKRTALTFNQAVEIYKTTEKKKSLHCDLTDLRKVLPYIGTLEIDKIYQGTITPYIEAEQKRGMKATTINRSLRIVSRILYLCVVSWRDHHHIPYLDAAPLIKQLPEIDKQTTRPIEYQEEQRLLAALLPHLRDFWLFAVNTGLREQNQIRLRWEWKVEMPYLNNYAFIIPAYVNGVKNTKNGKDFLLVLNSQAKAILEKWQDKDPIYVFPSPAGGHYSRYNNKPFRRCREKAGLKGIIKWHSARTTFATRLRAAGISKEDRAQLLGHSQSLTTEYSWASIEHLIECVESLCDTTQLQINHKMGLRSLFRLE